MGFYIKSRAFTYPWYLSILTLSVSLPAWSRHCIILSALDSWLAVFHRSLIFPILLIPYTFPCTTSTSLVLSTRSLYTFWIGRMYFLPSARKHHLSYSLPFIWHLAVIRECCFAPKHGIVWCHSCTACVICKHGSIQPHIPVILYSRPSSLEHICEIPVKTFHRIRRWIVRHSCCVLNLELGKQFPP